MAGNWFALLPKVWRQTIHPMALNLLENTWKAGKDADIIVYHPKVVGATDVSEATGARLVCAAPIPLFPTGAFPAAHPKAKLRRPASTASPTTGITWPVPRI